jgi:hypothetical protein
MAEMKRIGDKNESNAMSRALRLAVLVSAGALFASQSCTGQAGAQAKCPWLNAATAAGVLGGEVQMAVSAPVEPGPVKGVGTAMYSDQVRMDRFDVTCEFTRKVDAGTDTLSITVKTMSDQAKEFPSFLARCSGPTVPLRGIGNEAVQCVIRNTSDKAEQQVIARVRDRAFVLTITRPAAEAAAAAGDGLRDDTRNVAEQVAGSIF